MEPKRKPQRKHGYDYSQPGYYAVTICTQNRSCLFGVIDNGEMLLNDAGRMIHETWREIPDHSDIELDVMQIMPNHLHGIIVVREVGTGLCACPFSMPGSGRVQRPALTTLSDVIKRFKTLTTKRYIDGVRAHGWHSFSSKLWQRSFHDRIIRNETELNKFRTYICNNPNEWDSDANNIELKRKTEHANSEARFQRP